MADTPDLPPKGCITLKEAFSRYTTHMHGKVELVAERGGLFAAGRSGEPNLMAARRRLVSAFSDGELRAGVFVPNEGEKWLPTDAWQALGDWAEDIFMRDAIPTFGKQTWSKIRGLTPYVSEAEFVGWLIGERANSDQLPVTAESTRRQADPGAMDFWTAPMAVAWVLWRDLGRVAEWSPDSSVRQPATLMNLILAWFAAHEADSPTHPREAWEQLRDRCAATATPVWAVDLVTGRTSKISADDVVSLRYWGNTNLTDRFALDGLTSSPKYDSLKFRREDILKLWLGQPLQTPCSEEPTKKVKPARTKYDQSVVDDHFDTFKHEWLEDTDRPRLTWRAWHDNVAPAKFPGISIEQRRIAWNRRPPGWEVGRPPKTVKSGNASKVGKKRT